jgi:hypothetical protein
VGVVSARIVLIRWMMLEPLKAEGRAPGARRTLAAHAMALL